MLNFNPLEYPICLTFPSRVTASAWTQHVPFGMLLIDALRPRVLVELGSYAGVSYCGFCQAVKELQTRTQCYAVDTWQGDPQTGFYGDEVLADLKEHHDPLYGSFSRLIRSTFEEALTHFEDRSIDLLHIDGFHTYEAVKQDFESWLPKVSDRGVILFHDTNVRERDFGVWKLWAELKTMYPSFEMLHGHGLGLLAVGKERPEPLQHLLSLSPADQDCARQFFYQIGLRIEVAQQSQTLMELTKQQSEKIDTLWRRDSQLQELEQLWTVRVHNTWASQGVSGVLRKGIAKIRTNPTPANT